MNNLERWFIERTDWAEFFQHDCEVVAVSQLEKLLENYTLVSNNDISELEQAIKKLPISGIISPKIDEARVDLISTLNNIKNSGNF